LRLKKEKVRQEALKKGYTTFAEMWINFDKEHVGYDELFQKMADYIISHKIFR